jgi:uncharacterized protein YjbI with pentapeptide repeats
MIIDEDIGSAEVLVRYAAGIRDFTRLDIADDGDTPLAGANLRGADFSRSFLQCSFAGADLHNASFQEANVKACDFSNADLTAVDFTGAALCGTTFLGATMDGADFDGAYYHGIDFTGSFKPDW